MVQINFARRLITCKVLYSGAGLADGRAAMERFHRYAAREASAEPLVSIASESGPLLFFDFEHPGLKRLAGFHLRFQCFAVPAAFPFRVALKAVLQGSDGLVFVADSSPERLDDNLESLTRLEAALAREGLSLSAPCSEVMGKRGFISD